MGELGFLGLSCPRSTAARAATTTRTSCSPRRWRACELRRPGHGRRGAHRHGDAADPPVRDRGAEAGVARPRDRGQEDPLPRHHRARRGLRRRRHQDARRARRRRVRHQRLEDLHHQRPPRRRDRARHEDRSGRRLRRLHALPRADGLPRRHPREEAREARHARVRHRAARLPGRPRPGDRAARPGGQGLLPHHVGAPGRAADRRGGLRRGRPALLRPDAAVREGAQGVRPPDRQVPGHPPQVRRDGDEDRDGAPDGLHDRVALQQRRVPRARDLDGEALRLADRGRGRRRVHPDPRRRRLHEGVRRRARVARHAAEPHRRGHRRDHARRHRAVVRACRPWAPCSTTSAATTTR